jgi:hypothetical protein
VSSNEGKEEPTQNEFAAESDVEALRLATEEARSTLQQQIRFTSEIRRAVIRAFQIYLVFVGVLLSSFKILNRSQSESILNIFTIAGFIAFIIALSTGYFAYFGAGSTMGISKDYVDEVLEECYTEKEFLTLIIKSYGEWMDENGSMNDSLARLNYITQSLLINSAGLISYGIFSV